MQTKIAFLSSGPSPILEAMWGTDVKDDIYQLDNIPVFINWISLGDLFEAKIRFTDDERPYFQRVTKRSKNWTHHLLITDYGRKQPSAIANILDEVDTLMTGNHTRYQDQVKAYNVTPAISNSSRRLFEKALKLGEKDKLWEWEISSWPDLPLENIAQFVHDHPDVNM